ncbi:MAG: hypothetical protein H6625_08495 [Bdellovibrionaceae bacterium]|nr:hypothetical protein [Pseudobdellovibrionaceae bacterium]
MIFRFILLLLIFLANISFASEVKVGSKKDTETRLLAEIMAQLLESKDIKVKRRFGLGGTLITYKALESQSIDLYPEYTGTISQVILKNSNALNIVELNKELSLLGLEALPPFGFNNTYAIAMSAAKASQLNLVSISDLKHQTLSAAFSYEFLNRIDGWLNLKNTYELKNIKAIGIEHELAYQAIAEDKVDLMDAYSTDARLIQQNMLLLKDDKGFFPQYFAVPLVNSKLPIEVKEYLLKLAGKISENKMRELNSEVQLQKKSFKEIL